MSEIRVWLNGLDLGEYAEAFDAEKIRLSELPDLTEADLKDLGLPMGPRKAVLKAAAKIESVPAPEAVAPAPGIAERRQLTVMFCDLVGSTALSEKLDPEDLRDLMAAYRAAAGDVVGRYDGHVAQYLGDGVMAYFGWPRAHEDDAERAVRAGLELVAAVNRVESPVSLQVRIGIATGPVVVGVGSDEDAQASKLAVGETPNLAARLQGIARPNAIVIGPGTRRLTRNAFDYAELGAQNLKGILEPVPVWQVVGESGAEDRFEAQATGGLTDFVGRAHEFGLLMERWSQAEDGDGQVVLLSGEPGIGKSRITQELRASLAAEQHIRLRYQCSPYHVNSALHPVIAQFEHAAGFERGDSAEAKLDKMEAVLAETEDGLPVATLMAALLSLPTDRYPPLGLSPQRQKDQTLQALLGQVIALAAQAPLLLIMEDVHWIDPTTKDVLDLIIPGIQEHRVLMIITSRPEFVAPWVTQPNVTPLSLNRLARRQGGTMVAKVTGGKPLPEDVVDQIIAKSDGVPLFVEELTKTVLDAGTPADAGDHYQLTVPSSLRDSLMARLDRLETIKEVAQIGACIGREFSHDMIAAVSPMPAPALDGALDKLVATGLVQRRASSYTFKHALVQDAAYESLLKARRVELHGRVVDALVERLPELAKAQPELVAHHAMEAGHTALAIENWYVAGVRARDRSEITEAVALLERALDTIGYVEVLDGRDHWTFACNAALAPLYVFTLGMGSKKANDAYESARSLIEFAETEADSAVVRAGTMQSRMRHGKFEEAVAEPVEISAIFGSCPDRITRMAMELAAGWQAMFTAKNRDVLAYCQEIIEIYERNQDRHLSAQFGCDPLVTAFVCQYFSNWELGYIGAAREAFSNGLAWAEELAHPPSLHLVLSVAGADGHAAAWARQPEAVRVYATRAITLSEQYGLDLNQTRIHLGWAMTQLGDTEAGIREATQAIESYWAAGAGMSIGPRLAAEVAEAYANAGLAQDGLRLMRDAPDRKASDGKPRRMAEIYRIEGELLWALPDFDSVEVEHFLSEAVVIADEDNHVTRGLRAATSLARFLIERGRDEEARDVLAPRYARFTEGFDMPDLIAAKALLDELA